MFIVCKPFSKTTIQCCSEVTPIIIVVRICHPIFAGSVHKSLSKMALHPNVNYPYPEFRGTHVLTMVDAVTIRRCLDSGCYATNDVLDTISKLDFSNVVNGHDRGTREQNELKRLLLNLFYDMPMEWKHDPDNKVLMYALSRITIGPLPSIENHFGNTDETADLESFKWMRYYNAEQLFIQQYFLPHNFSVTDVRNNSSLRGVVYVAILAAMWNTQMLHGSPFAFDTMEHKSYLKATYCTIVQKANDKFTLALLAMVHAFGFTNIRAHKGSLASWRETHPEQYRYVKAFVAYVHQHYNAEPNQTAGRYSISDVDDFLRSTDFSNSLQTQLSKVKTGGLFSVGGWNIAMAEMEGNQNHKKSLGNQANKRVWYLTFRIWAQILPSLLDAILQPASDNPSAQAERERRGSAPETLRIITVSQRQIITTRSIALNLQGFEETDPKQDHNAINRSRDVERRDLA